MTNDTQSCIPNSTLKGQFPSALSTYIHEVLLNLNPTSQASLPPDSLQVISCPITFPGTQPESTLHPPTKSGSQASQGFRLVHRPCDSSHPLPHRGLPQPRHLFARTIFYELPGLQNLPSSSPPNA